MDHQTTPALLFNSQSRTGGCSAVRRLEASGMAC